NLPFDPNNLSGLGGPFPGVPEYNTAGTALATTPIPPFVPVNPGIDDINKVTSSGIPNNINNVGTNPTPFPAGPPSPPSGLPVAPWSAALFNCRQAFTGSVQNYIPDVRLKGDLKISPAITPAGDLRIAKVSLSSLSEPVPTHFAVAACLSLYSVLAAQRNSTD